MNSLGYVRLHINLSFQASSKRGMKFSALRTMMRSKLNIKAEFALTYAYFMSQITAIPNRGLLFVNRTFWRSFVLIVNV